MLIWVRLFIEKLNNFQVDLFTWECFMLLSTGRFSLLGFYASLEFRFDRQRARIQN